jgi:hypothetical protein
MYQSRIKEKSPQKIIKKNENLIFNDCTYDESNDFKSRVPLFPNPHFYFLTLFFSIFKT